MAYWVVIFFSYFPAVLLLIAWVATLRSRSEKGQRSVIPLIVATGSIVLLGICHAFPSILEPYSTNIRIGIMNSNFLAMLISTIVAWRKITKISILIGIACFMLTIAWAFAAAISSVV